MLIALISGTFIVVVVAALYCVYRESECDFPAQHPTAQHGRPLHERNKQKTADDNIA